MRRHTNSEPMAHDMTDKTSRRKGRLIIVTPDNDLRGQDYERDDEDNPDLKTLQEIVGGCIESLYVELEGIRRRAFVNENGQRLGLRVNVAGSLLAEATGFTAYGPILGNLVVLIPDFYEKTILELHPTKQ
jgi:hypothetical protein